MIHKFTPELIALLTHWATRPDASTDLRNIFGVESHQSESLLQLIREGDSSWIPEIQILPAASMEIAYGAYARETGAIYLSEDCPSDLVTAVVLEEIGHHIDALFNEQETSGDEGALFSAVVRGISLSDEEITALLNEDDSAVLSLNGHQVAVECASRGPAAPSPRGPAPPPRAPSKPIVTVKPASNAPVAPGELIISAISYDLSTSAPDAKGLSLIGNSDLIGVGNSQKTNFLTANNGNTTLVAGSASSTLVGGAGNNTLIGSTANGTDSIIGGSGSSTIFAGNGSATLIGGTLNNYIRAGTGNQSLYGGVNNSSSLYGNTLLGGIGKNTLRAGTGNNTLISGSVTATSSLTATAAKGLTSVAVADISGFAVGQKLSGIGVAAGTTVTAISGNRLTLSRKLTSSISSGATVSGSGANTLLGGGVSNSLVAGGGNDSLSAISGSSELYGGAGKTTLVAGSGTNWLQSRSTGIGGNTLLGANGKSNTLVAGAGSADSLVGSSGAASRNSSNSFLFTQNNLGNQRIVTDALSANYGINNSLLLGFDGQTVGDSTFAGAWVSNMGKIQITTLVGAEGDLVSLGANAQKAGIRTLIGGSGNDTLSVAGYSSLGGALLDARASQQNTTLIGGAGNDTFYGTTAGSDSINGGGGNNSIYYSKQDFGYSTVNGGSSSGKNTLIMSGQDVTLQGVGFSNVSNISSLSLSGGLNVISDLKGSGIKRITGGTGSESLAAQIDATTIAVGSLGSSSLQVDSAAGLAVGQQVSGSGIAQGTTITAISGNVLTLSDALVSNISQGSIIDGWIDGATLDGSRSFTDPNYSKQIDITTNQDAVAGSTQLILRGTPEVTVGMQLQGDGITPGTSITGISYFSTLLTTITLSSPTTQGYRGNESLLASYSFGGEHLEAMGKNVLLIGSTQAGSDATLSTTYRESNSSVAHSTLVAGAYAGNTLLGGAFDNTFILNTQTAVGTQSNALGNISTATHLGTSSTPSRGIGTLILANDGATLTDSAFSKVAKDALQIFQSGDGANSFALGANAANAGIQTIILGSGNDSLSLATPQQYSAATIDGGAGTNFLAVGSGARLNDNFTNISNIQALSLSGVGAGATLGTNARYEGITTLFGGDGGATLTQLQAPDFTTSIQGTAGDNTLLASTNKGFAVGEPITGTGVPNGTIVTSITGFSIALNGYTVTLSNPLNGSWPGAVVNTARVISINGSNVPDTTGTAGNATLNAAGATGFAAGDVVLGTGVASGTIITAINGDTLTLSKPLTSRWGASQAQSQITATYITPYAATLVGGVSNDLFSIATADQYALDSIVGAAGRDTLSVGEALTINDALQGNVTGIEVLKLSSSSSVTLGAGLRDGANKISMVIGGGGGDTFTQTADYASGLTLSGIGGGNLYNLAEAAFLTADSIVGGSGLDTLALGTAATLNDAFTRLSSIEVLSLSGASAVTLGAAAKTVGIASVIGGSGNNTLVQTSADTLSLYLSGGGGNDSISVATGIQLSSDTISGGLGTDTLVVGTASSLNVDSSNVSGIEFLSLSGNSSLTLGSGSKSAAVATVVAGSGNDFFAIADQSVYATKTITGGAGTDTLSLGGVSSTLADTDLSRISGIEFLSLSSSSLSGSSVTLGSSALAAGIRTLAGGSGNDTIIQTAADTLSLSLSGGEGNDSISIATAAQFLADSISGGVGRDTLSIAAPVTLGDASFSKISDIEVLQIASSSSVTLGSLAQQKGITSVVLGNGSDTVNASAYTRSITLDATANTGANPNLLIGSSTAGTNFLFSSVTAFAAGSLRGGTANDTLAFSQSAAISDYDLAHASGVQVLSLSGSSSVVLGAAAKDNNLITVIGGSGNDTFVQTTADTLSTTLVGGEGNDSFLLYTSAIFAADSISGGIGIDTITINSSATLNDAFSRLSGIEVLSLAGPSSVTLGSAAQSAGLQSLFGGSGNDSFLVSSASNYSQWTLAGGGGTDTLALGSAATLSDAFTNLSGIEILSLSGASSVTLGSAAQSAGLQTILGGNGASSFTQLSSDTLALALVGGTLGDSFSIATAAQLAADSILGGLGNDTLSLGEAVTRTDAQLGTLLGGVTGIEALQFAASSNVTLGAAVIAKGISTVAGGAGDDTFTQTSDFSTGLTLDGMGGSDLFSISDSSFLVRDSLIGGDGLDTVSLGTSLSSNDSFANFSGIEVLSLSGASSVTLGSAAQSAGLQSLFGGSGNDSFLVSSASNYSQWTLAGGGGTDTLALGSAATLSDAFTNLSGIEILSLSGASSVTLGSAAQSAGLQTILGGNGASSFTQLSSDTLALALVGGTLGDSFSIATAAQLAADSILGGLGNDTLSLDEAVTRTDAQLGTLLGGVTGIEALQFAASSNVTLGAAVIAKGISTVAGGAGDDTFTQTSDFSTGLTLDGMGGSDLFSISDSSFLVRDSLIGGDGLDTVSLGTSLSSNDSFANFSGIEVLSLSGASSVTLGSAAQSAGLQSLFGGSGNDSFTTTVGLRFINAGNGNNTLSGSSYGFDTLIGGTGNDSITGNGTAVSLSGGEGINVIESRGNGSTLVGGSGSDTLSVLGSAFDNLVITGSGNALISFGGETAFTSASLTGSTGNHTLQFTGSVELNDEFYNIGNGITRSLSLTGTSSVVLGFSGELAGIESVTAGQGNDAIDATAYNSSVTLNGGNGNNSLIGGNAADSIIAGNGNDTLQGWGLTASGANPIDTLVGGSGSDLFVLGDVSENAYGSSSSSNHARIEDFVGNAGNDSLVLHNFGSGASDYTLSTVSANEVKIFLTTSGNEVANIFGSNLSTILTTNTNFV